MAVSTTAIMIASAAASAVQAVGAIQSGQAQSKQAAYQAQVYQQQAAREREVAASQEEDYRRQQSRLMAARRAALGASGIEASTGSPLLVSQDFAGEAELQALRIRNAGDVSATRLEQQAGLTRAEGASARTAGFMRAGSSLLSGFGEAYRYKQPGIGTGTDYGKPKAGY